MTETLECNIQYYGASPWEIEVLYESISARFKVIQKEIEFDEESNFVTMINITLPVQFNDDFFKWFEFKRWERIKFLFKEMKRRRGDRKRMKIVINFTVLPAIKFILDTKEGHLYNNAVEKIETVLELLKYHIDSAKITTGITQGIYKFDSEKSRWVLHTIHTDSKEFTNIDGKWKVETKEGVNS
ncbi:MAG: hypothetical protein R1F52_05795 [Candidatus Nitrosoabyssus spongiisocia]|nr:MAG: hypothetical protein R1F52_05795 [Nitrosopumilaceae archaeon AB1(1)]